jgi:hypothetical protein
MKLVPLLRFLGRRQKEEEEDFMDELPEQLLQFPTEEEAESSAEEGDEEEAENEAEVTDEEEAAAESESAGGPGSGQDDLLKVFLAAEEEYADTLALASEVDEVSAAELLVELREVAVTLNLPSARESAG